jgi:hypothetical protein
LAAPPVVLTPRAGALAPPPMLPRGSVWETPYAACPVVGPPVAAPPPARAAEPQPKARPTGPNPNEVIKDMVEANKRAAVAKAQQEAAKKQKAELRAPLPAARSASHHIDCRSIARIFGGSSDVIQAAFCTQIAAGPTAIGGGSVESERAGC